MTYTARHLIFAALLGLILGALAVRAVYAAAPRPAQPVIADWQWRQVAPATAGRTEVSSSWGDPSFPAVPAAKAAEPTAPHRAASMPGTILDPFPVSPPPERAAVEVPAPELVVREKATPRPAKGGSGGHSLTGSASWGAGWAGVVTRLPRGTAICVAGPLGRWCGASVGYGPAVWTGRIADLSRAVFGDICGPVSAGLCRVVLSW